MGEGYGSQTPTSSKMFKRAWTSLPVHLSQFPIHSEAGRSELNEFAATQLLKHGGWREKRSAA